MVVVVEVVSVHKQSINQLHRQLSDWSGRV